MESRKLIHLDNGVEVLLQPVSGLHKVGISIGLRYGALYEKKIGLASLMQNVIYKPRVDMQAILRLNGIEYGSFVGYDEVVNSASCSPDKVNMTLDDLCKIVFEPSFSKKSTEIEKTGLMLENIREMDSPEDGVVIRLEDIASFVSLVRSLVVPPHIIVFP